MLARWMEDCQVRSAHIHLEVRHMCKQRLILYKAFVGEIHLDLFYSIL